MAELNFPTSPTANQTYTVGSKTWKWSGYAWDLLIASGTTEDTTARTMATSAGDYANSAFANANTALAQIAVLSGGTATDGWARDKANTSSSYANSAYLQANSAYLSQNTTGLYANAAFFRANNSLNVQAGGTVTGDISITGNLTVTGTTTYVNTTTINLADNIITLNSDLAQGSGPTENAGIEVERGLLANVQILWNETSDQWTFTNDGTSYSSIGAQSGELYANAAFGIANSASSYANGAFAQANNVTAASSYANSGFGVANSASSYANGAFAQANNVTAASSYANGAFGVANSASSYANGAFAAANTDYTTISTTAGIYGGSANIPVITVTANGRISSVTNTSISIPSGTSVYGNTGQITANVSTGTVALGLATSGVTATTYGDSSNIPVITVDSYGRITSATTTTVSGGGGGVAAGAGYGVNADRFVGDGTSTIFILSTTAPSSNSCIVNIDGVLQLKDAYSLSTNQITFSSAPLSGQLIDVFIFKDGEAYNVANSAYDQANTALQTANTKTTLGKSIAMTIVFGG